MTDDDKNQRRRVVTGFRIDPQRLIFSALVLLSGGLFVKLATWTGLHFLGYGSVGTTLLALYYFITSFSLLRDED